MQQLVKLTDSPMLGQFFGLASSRREDRMHGQCIGLCWKKFEKVPESMKGYEGHTCREYQKCK